jgi:hypothetical protein
MLDGVAAMTRFCNLIASEPDVGRVPLCLVKNLSKILHPSSSLKVSRFLDFNVILSGLVGFFCFRGRASMLSRKMYCKLNLIKRRRSCKKLFSKFKLYFMNWKTTKVFYYRNLLNELN